MKNKLFLVLTIVLIMITNLFIFTQNIDANEDNKIRISVSPSPSSIPVFYLLENSELNLEVDIHKNRNIVISNFMKENIDMALLATNEAAKLYNKSIDVKLAGVHTWGIFYLATSNSNLKEWADLKNQKISLPDKGGPMDIVFSFLAKENNINVDKDLKVRRGKVRELSQLMINYMTETAVLREPFLTQVLKENSNVDIMIDLQKEWKAKTGMNLPQSSLVLHGNYANDDNKETINQFNTEYKEAIKWVNNNPKKAAEIAEKYMDIKKDITESSTPRLNLKYKKALEIKEEIKNYFEILEANNPKTIGGDIPDENFYLQY